MHPDALAIDPDLVAALLQEQFPAWADRPLHPVPSGGTDNALFRLGDELVVRLPYRQAGAAAQIQKEHTWLPKLSSRVPLEVPFPVVMGLPGQGYPCPWSIYRWIDGENVAPGVLASDPSTARGLADFVRALGKVDLAKGPRPGEHNFGRGAPLIERDEATREGIDACTDDLDVAAAGRIWRAGLEASQVVPERWIHGDLKGDNLLFREGQLAAVIDFGGLAVGDPAYDLTIAWTGFAEPARNTFREHVSVDEDTWQRARALALSIAVIALPYYRASNPVMAQMARFTMRQLGIARQRS